MKVLLVNQTGQLGGGELSMLEYARSTSNYVEVILFDDGPLRLELEESNILVHLVDIGQISGVRRTASIVTLLKVAPEVRALRDTLRGIAKGFDVVYANSQKAFIVCAFSMRRDVPLVWHLRDVLSSEHFSYSVRKFATLVGNRAASVVITNSQATGSALKACGGDSKKIVTIYNGIDHAPFDQVTTERIQAFREQLGVSDVCLIGGFGRLTFWKGQHVLIAALASLPGNTHVLIVGDALFGETAYAEGLRRQATLLKVADRVHFLGFRRDIPFLMRAVDIVAHTAIAPEPFGRVLVEGMLAERAVIASQAGGALEILDSGESGLLIRPNSSSELVEAVQKVQADPVWARQIARNGRIRAESKFSVRTMVSEIDSLLEKLVMTSDTSD